MTIIIITILQKKKKQLYAVDSFLTSGNNEKSNMETIVVRLHKIVFIVSHNLLIYDVHKHHIIWAALFVIDFGIFHFSLLFVFR